MKLGNLLSGALYGALALPMAAFAQDESERELDAKVEVGLGYVSDDSFRYGRYTGLVDQGLVPWLNVELASETDWDSEDTRYWSVQGRDVGLDTIFLDAELGDHGDQAVSLAYREIPLYFFDDGQTPFRLVGDNHWILPDDWQVGGDSTQTMTNLSAHLAPVKIQHERKRLDLSYTKQLAAAWQFETHFRREIKEGWRTLGAMIGSNGGNARGAILPSSVDFETDIMELALGYTGKKSTLGLNYHGSFFNNNDKQLGWQNPFGLQTQWAAGVAYPDGQGSMALEPDNSSHRLSVAGSYAFSSITHGSVELGYGKILQDDDFLPYTVNPALSVPAPLARNSLDGEIETFSANFRLATRPMAAIYLVTRYRLDDRDNHTPRMLYLPAPGDAQDQVGAEEGVLNRPYSYRQQTLSIDARYRATRRVRVDAGYEVVQIDRDYSEVNETREYTAKLGTTLRTFANVSFNVTYEYSERRGERYVGNRPLIQAHLPGTVAQEDFENHPLLRKYYLAERHRDRIQFRGDWFASDRLTLGFNAAYNRDDYTDAHFGLNEMTLTSYTLDSSYRVSEHFHIGGFFSIDTYGQDQSGRSFTAAPGQAQDPDRNWQVDSADRFTTLNITAEYQEVQQRFAVLREWGLQGSLDAGLELSDSRSTGDVDTKTGPALDSAPLPELETRLRYYRLYASYKLSESSLLSFSLSRERYDSDDFRLDGVGPATMERVLSLGEESQDYSVNWIGLGYRRRF